MHSVQHDAGFDLPQPLERVFPLFTPEGEKSWAPGWDFESPLESAGLSEDYVFLTKSHDHAGGDAIWLVKRYEPRAGLVAYYRVEPGEKVGVVTVQCASLKNGGTRVQVTYRYIPLSDRGQAFMERYTKAAHEAFISHWEKLLLEHFAADPSPPTGGIHDR